MPDFSEFQKRTLLNDPFKIKLGAERLPASFVVYNCLWVESTNLLEQPLMDRKVILNNLVRVVAKEKSSLYYPGKRTKDWIKFKRMQDEDFVICGYIRKSDKTYSLILGKYRGARLVYKGHVTLGVSVHTIGELKPGTCSFAVYPTGNENAEWCRPEKVGMVEYMPNTRNILRQAVFKGFRNDLEPEEVEE